MQEFKAIFPLDVYQQILIMYQSWQEKLCNILDNYLNFPLNKSNKAWLRTHVAVLLSCLFSLHLTTEDVLMLFFFAFLWKRAIKTGKYTYTPADDSLPWL